MLFFPLHLKLMNIVLNEIEARVLGALVEKDITTPDYYPLSLNALVNACNQKKNRDPVMNLEEGTVRDALNGLHDHRLAGPVSGADSRVTKYEHRLQETFNFSRGETAVLCAMLLRGSQTPGERSQPIECVYRTAGNTRGAQSGVVISRTTHDRQEGPTPTGGLLREVTRFEELGRSRPCGRVESRYGESEDCGKD